MRTPVESTASSAARILPALQWAVPMLAATSFFVFRGEAADINDPDLPIAFRVGKDVAFMLMVFIPLLYSVYARGLSMRLPVLVFWLAPVALAGLMLLLGVLKGDVGFVPASQVRNMSFYYVGAGAVVFLAVRYGYLMRLFTVFRFFMAVSVLFGLAVYLFADNVLYYTIHGRMIGTHGNPNFLGYLSFLWLVVIHGTVYTMPRLTKLIVAETALAAAGIVGAVSVAAFLCYVGWLCLAALLLMLRVLPRSRPLRRLLGWQLIGGAVAALAVASIVETLDPGTFDLALRIHGIITGTSESTTIRGAAMSDLLDGLNDPATALLGQNTTSAYVQFDGSAPAILYNLGLPFYLLWAGFFLTPVVFVARRWRDLTALRTTADGLALALTLFLVVSVFVEFWIQYVPEMFPTCFAIGWVMYFLVWHTSGAGAAPTRNAVPRTQRT